MTVRLALVTCLAAALAGAALAQDASLSASATWSGEWQRRDAALEVALSRPLEPEEGRLAVWLGRTDLTDLFAATPGGLRYRADLAPLPAGESELVVYRVPPSGPWLELARLPVRVLTPRGFETLAWSPRLDLQSDGLFDEGGSAATGGARGLREAGGQADLQGHAARRGWSARWGANLLASSAAERRLRFADKGDDAPPVDLASYRFRLERGRGAVELGHLTWGTHRHLAQSFTSRGLAVDLPLWPGAELAVGGLAGSSLVGWENLSGLSQSDHRLFGVRFGAELLARRPGALRLDVTWVDASLLPVAGFQQGVVNDAEESRGLGLQLSARAFGERLRLDASWAENRFASPFDPDLAQGAELVAVVPETREARYLQVALDLLRDRALSPRVRSTWTALLRHERVEPQYRVAAAFVQADAEQDALELHGTVGPAAVQLAHTRGRDNLDRIATLLTTRTERDGAIVTLPLGGWTERPRPALPLLTLALEQVRQAGDGVPPDSGFAPSHVPDQVSRNLTAGSEWSGERWRLAYRFSRSDQDNRQPGRERADFGGESHQAQLTWTASPRLDLGLDLATEEAENRELDERLFTDRYGVNLLWRPTDRLSLSAQLSWTETRTRPVFAESEGLVGDAQLAWRFERRRAEHRGLGAQLYLRLSSQTYEALDRRFALYEERDAWALRSGINLSLF